MYANVCSTYMYFTFTKQLFCTKTRTFHSMIHYVDRDDKVNYIHSQLDIFNEIVYSEFFLEVSISISNWQILGKNIQINSGDPI